jgi:hypothetical protein
MLYLFHVTHHPFTNIAKEPNLVSPIYGWLGFLPAVGILIGIFEETGFKAAGLINAISYLLWSLWLIALLLQ